MFTFYKLQETELKFALCSGIISYYLHLYHIYMIIILNKLLPAA